jgi:hypothetical protein
MSNLHFNNVGQINLNSKFSNFIIDLIQNNDINSIIETGTWNGCGSTRCLYEGLKSKSNPKLISFETDYTNYIHAKNLYSSIPWIEIIHGSIIKSEEFINQNLDDTHKSWLDEDIVRYKNASFVDLLDQKFDLAFLDSSEFGGFAEFLKIKDRCKYLAIDDTNILKHRQTREYCINNYTCLADHLDDRNGWAIFKL